MTREIEAENNCVDAISKPCCVPCNKEKPIILKDNYSCEGCSPLTVRCTTIDKAVCTPILCDRIFDCICIEKEQNSYLEGVEFEIEGKEYYAPADSICIQKIGITYSFIGLENKYEGPDKDENKTVIIDGMGYPLDPLSKFKCGFGHDSNSLFNKLEGTISLNRCCCLNPSPTASKTRIIEKHREFMVCGLQIKIAGMIGCKPFTATSLGIKKHGHHNGGPGGNSDVASPSGGSVTVGPGGLDDKRPVSLTHDLGFDNVTFIGKLCLPVGSTKPVIHEDFDSCLEVEAITPTENYKPNKKFDASIEYSFKVNKKIFATVKEQLAVFSSPITALCRDGSVLSSCASNCPDNPQ